MGLSNYFHGEELDKHGAARCLFLDRCLVAAPGSQRTDCVVRVISVVSLFLCLHDRNL